uniref:Uncharacterized protein n=1 Tax=Anguilla anguilla TaxID=7936 RepID=A0A0E9VSN1_ANGAN
MEQRTSHTLATQLHSEITSPVTWR